MTKKDFFRFIERYGNLSPHEFEEDNFRYIMDFKFDGDIRFYWRRWITNFLRIKKSTKTENAKIIFNNKRYN